MIVRAPTLRPRCRPRLTAALLAWLLAVCPALAAADEGALALKVKAAVLFNFAKFVTWPSSKFRSSDDPLLLCVLLPDALGNTLDESVRGKTVNGRPLKVRRAAQAAELRDCHLVYSSDERVDALTEALSTLSGHSVLVVHEYAQPLRDGSIRLLINDRRLRFEINVAAVEREQLQLSSKLLVLSDVVRR